MSNLGNLWFTVGMDDANFQRQIDQAIKKFEEKSGLKVGFEIDSADLERKIKAALGKDTFAVRVAVDTSDVDKALDKLSGSEKLNLSANVEVKNSPALASLENTMKRLNDLYNSISSGAVNADGFSELSEEAAAAAIQTERMAQAVIATETAKNNLVRSEYAATQAVSQANKAQLASLQYTLQAREANKKKKKELEEINELIKQQQLGTEAVEDAEIAVGLAMNRANATYANMSKKEINRQSAAYRNEISARKLAEAATLEGAAVHKVAEAQARRQIQEEKLLQLKTKSLQKEKEITKEAEKQGKEAKKTGEENEKNVATLDEIGGSLRNIVSIYAAGRYIKSIVEATAEFEMQRITLGAILRDSIKAREVFTDIKELAVKSPFEFKDLITYTKQLSAFSVPKDELFDTMSMLSDVSAGLGVTMDRLVLAFGQIRSASFLRGQEVRQLTEAGIPILEELAKQFQAVTGEMISAGEVFDRISNREVPFKMVEQVFKNMTAEGGKFYKMQEKQAETVRGKLANISDALNIAMAEIGDIFSKQIHGVADATFRIAQNLRTVLAYAAPLAGMVGTLGILKNVAISLGVAQGKLSGIVRVLKGIKDSVAAVDKYFKSIGVSTAAWSVALLAVTAVITAIAVHAAKVTAFKRELNDSLSSLAKDTDELRESFEKLSQTLNGAVKGSQEYKDTISKINSNYGEFLNNILTEADALEQLKGQYDGVINKINEKARAQALDEARALIYKKADEKYNKAMDRFMDWGATAESADKYIRGEKALPLFLRHSPLSGAVKEYNRELEKANKLYEIQEEKINLRLNYIKPLDEELERLKEIVEWEKKEKQLLYEGRSGYKTDTEIEVDALKKRIELYDSLIKGIEKTGNIGKQQTRLQYELVATKKALDELLKGYDGYIKIAKEIIGGTQGVFVPQETDNYFKAVESWQNEYKRFSEELALLNSLSGEAKGPVETRRIEALKKNISVLKQLSQRLNFSLQKGTSASASSAENEQEKRNKEKVKDIELRIELMEQLREIYKKLMEEGFSGDEIRLVLPSIVATMGLDEAQEQMALMAIEANSFDTKIAELISGFGNLGDAGKEAARKFLEGGWKNTVDAFTDLVEKVRRFEEDLGEAKAGAGLLTGEGAIFGISNVAREYARSNAKADKEKEKRMRELNRIEVLMTEEGLEEIAGLRDKYGEDWKKKREAEIEFICEREKENNKRVAQEKMNDLAKAYVDDALKAGGKDLLLNNLSDLSMGQLNGLRKYLRSLEESLNLDIDPSTTATLNELGYSIKDLANSQEAFDAVMGLNEGSITQSQKEILALLVALEAGGIKVDMFKEKLEGLIAGKRKAVEEEQEEGLFDAYKKGARVVDELADRFIALGEATGNENLTNLGNLAKDVTGFLGRVGEGAQIGGWIGAIVGAVIGAGELVIRGVARAAEAQAMLDNIRDGLKETMDDEAFQALIGGDKVESVFGESLFTVVAEQAKAATDATQLFYDTLSKGQELTDTLAQALGLHNLKIPAPTFSLEGMDIKTGKKNKAFRDLFPELFDGGGRINKEAFVAWYDTANELLGKQNDFTREILDNLYKAFTQEEKAAEALRESVSNIFGSLAADISASMIDSFIELGDAAAGLPDIFQDISRSILDNLVQGALLDSVLVPMQGKLMAIMGDTSLTDEQRALQLQGFMDELQGGVQDFAEMQNMIMRIAEQTGMLDPALFEVWSEGFKDAVSDAEEGMERLRYISGQYDALMRDETDAVWRDSKLRAEAMQMVGEELRKTLDDIYKGGQEEYLLTDEDKALAKYKDDIELYKGVIDTLGELRPEGWEAETAKYAELLEAVTSALDKFKTEKYEEYVNELAEAYENVYDKIAALYEELRGAGTRAEIAFLEDYIKQLEGDELDRLRKEFKSDEKKFQEEIADLMRGKSLAEKYGDFTLANDIQKAIDDKVVEKWASKMEEAVGDMETDYDKLLAWEREYVRLLTDSVTGEEQRAAMLEQSAKKSQELRKALIEDGRSSYTPDDVKSMEEQAKIREDMAKYAAEYAKALADAREEDAAEFKLLEEWAARALDEKIAEDFFKAIEEGMEGLTDDFARLEAWKQALASIEASDLSPEQVSAKSKQAQEQYDAILAGIKDTLVSTYGTDEDKLNAELASIRSFADGVRSLMEQAVSEEDKAFWEYWFERINDVYEKTRNAKRTDFITEGLEKYADDEMTAAKELADIEADILKSREMMLGANEKEIEDLETIILLAEERMDRIADDKRLAAFNETLETATDDWAKLALYEAEYAAVMADGNLSLERREYLLKTVQKGMEDLRKSEHERAFNDYADENAKWAKELADIEADIAHYAEQASLARAEGRTDDAAGWDQDKAWASAALVAKRREAREELIADMEAAYGDEAMRKAEDMAAVVEHITKAEAELAKAKAEGNVEDERRLENAIRLAQAERARMEAEAFYEGHEEALADMADDYARREAWERKLQEAIRDTAMAEDTRRIAVEKAEEALTDLNKAIRKELLDTYESEGVAARKAMGKFDRDIAEISNVLLDTTLTDAERKEWEEARDEALRQKAARIDEIFKEAMEGNESYKSAFDEMEDKSIETVRNAVKMWEQVVARELAAGRISQDLFDKLMADTDELKAKLSDELFARVESSLSSIASILSDMGAGPALTGAFDALSSVVGGVAAITASGGNIAGILSGISGVTKGLVSMRTAIQSIFGMDTASILEDVKQLGEAFDALRKSFGESYAVEDYTAAYEAAKVRVDRIWELLETESAKKQRSVLFGLFKWGGPNEEYLDQLRAEYEQAKEDLEGFEEEWRKNFLQTDLESLASALTDIVAGTIGDTQAMFDAIDKNADEMINNIIKNFLMLRYTRNIVQPALDSLFADTDNGFVLDTEALKRVAPVLKEGMAGLNDLFAQVYDAMGWDYDKFSNERDSNAGVIGRSVTEATATWIKGILQNLNVQAADRNNLLRSIDAKVGELTRTNVNTFISIAGMIEENTRRTADNTDRLADIDAKLGDIRGRMGTDRSLL